MWLRGRPINKEFQHCPTYVVVVLIKGIERHELGYMGALPLFL